MSFASTFFSDVSSAYPRAGRIRRFAGIRIEGYLTLGRQPDRFLQRFTDLHHQRPSSLDVAAAVGTNKPRRLQIVFNLCERSDGLSFKLVDARRVRPKPPHAGQMESPRRPGLAELVGDVLADVLCFRNTSRVALASSRGYMRAPSGHSARGVCKNSPYRKRHVSLSRRLPAARYTMASRS